MTTYPDDRVALFIDGSNLYAAARGLGFDIDYKQLLEVFKQKGRLVRAFYYTALLEDHEYSGARRFWNAHWASLMTMVMAKEYY